jgi:pyruvate dehydrogenase E2 component (dihydrolipoamide acetyltransferase)
MTDRRRKTKDIAQMPIEVLVPPLGQTVDVVKLVSWYMSEGDTVQQGEPLFVIETDKATLDVEAPASGILRRVTAAPGDDVKALSAIALITAPGEEVKVEVQAKVEGKAEAQPVPLSTSTSTLTSVSASRRFVSPRARRLAEAEGAPLEAIQPTGPEGAIIERDVRAYLEKVKAEAEVKAEEPLAKFSTPLPFPHSPARPCLPPSNHWRVFPSPASVG